MGVEGTEKDWRRGHLFMAITSLRNQEVIKMGAGVCQVSEQESFVAMFGVWTVFKQILALLQIKGPQEENHVLWG